jgi:histidinol-phosphate aminotransferase
MRQPTLSRRRFAASLAAVAGALAASPRVARASLARNEASDLIQLNSNENPYGPSERALRAMSESQAVAARYPDALEDEMVEAVAEHHGLPKSRVVLGCGSAEILRLCDAAFLRPGRTVVAAEPTFETVLGYAGVQGGLPVKVPLDAAYRHDLAAMAKACDARTGLVYVCNPNNPTGTIVSGDALEAFLGRVPKTAVVLVDEAYHHFVEDPSYRSMDRMLDRFPNLVVARTFSKIYGMAGMRLGYALCSEENVQKLKERGFWGNLNSAVLAAGRESLRDTAHTRELRDRMNATRRWLVAELQKDGRRVIPSEGNFMMIEIGSDVKPVIDAFRERKILVGRRFPALPTFLRITVGTQEETAAFVAALRAIVPAKAAAA